MRWGNTREPVGGEPGEIEDVNLSALVKVSAGTPVGLAAVLMQPTGGKGGVIEKIDISVRVKVGKLHEPIVNENFQVFVIDLVVPVEVLSKRRFAAEPLLSKARKIAEVHIIVTV